MNKLTISFDPTHKSISDAITELELMVELYRNDDPDYVAETDTEADTTAVTLDRKRRPHDPRIHGSGKKFMKAGERAGEWKYVKGVPPALIAEVEAELDALMAADTAPPKPPVADTAPPKPPAADTKPPIPPKPPAADTTPPKPPVADAPEPLYILPGGAGKFTLKALLEAGYKDADIRVLPIAEVPVNIDWPTMLVCVSDGIAEGKFTQLDVDNACTKFGIESYPTLVARPDLIPAVHAELFK